MTIFSLAVILPVNFQGKQGLTKENNFIKINKILYLEIRAEKFAHTTIANLSPE